MTQSLLNNGAAASQVEAKKIGQRFYFTNRPCKRGHIAKRFAANGTCAECGREQVKGSYIKNREEIQVRRNARRKENPHPYRERERAHYWADHAAATAINQHKRASRLGLESTLTGQDIIDKISEQNGFCIHCNTQIQLTVDHIIPLSKRGPNTRNNIQMLCKPCNSAKGDK